MLDVGMVGAMQVIGTAGGSLNQMKGNYGAASVRTGKRGEQKTVKVLKDLFVHDDDIYLFNDLAMPGRKGRDGQDANIDHVLLRGTNVVVVDSKHWKPGFYFSVAHHGFRAPITPVPYLTSGTVDLAIGRLATRLPRAHIKGVTLVHPTNPKGTCNTTFVRPRGNTRVYPATSIRATLFLRQALGPAAPPDPEVLRHLHNLTHKAR